MQIELLNTLRQLIQFRKVLLVMFVMHLDASKVPCQSIEQIDAKFIGISDKFARWSASIG